MAITGGGGITSTQNKTSSTTQSAAVNATISANTIVIICVSSDNLGTVTGETNEHISMTDSQSNSYTKLYELSNARGAAAGGVTTSIWKSKLSTQLISSNSVTVTFNGSVTAKVITGASFRVDTGNDIFNFMTPVTNMGINSAIIEMTINPGVTREWLYVRTNGIEGASSIAGATSWSNLTTNTSGGGGASNMAGNFESRIITNSTITNTPTSALAGDNVSLLFALYEDTPSAFTPVDPMGMMGIFGL